MRNQLSGLKISLRHDILRNIVRRSVGEDYLEGWVEQPAGANPEIRQYVRAFGTRTVYIIAGNSPSVAVMTLLRNALTRSDAIVKAPSNDPVTAAALVRTLVEMDPDHPLAKHISVGYWKGGDEQVEQSIYHPHRIEKLVAWGGFASVQHVKKYLRPGLELIALDPKFSSTLIGSEAFADAATEADVAKRLALDIGGGNQEGCVNARVIYVASGTDDAGLERLGRLGRLTFEAIQDLPPHFSTAASDFDPALKAEIDGIRLMPEDFRVFGGTGNEGAIIVSQSDNPVDFSRLLAHRVGNLVPVDDLDTAVQSINAYTQRSASFLNS